MLDFNIVTCYAYLGNKWAPPAPVWWPVGTVHIPELCCSVLDPAFGSMGVEPSVLTQHQEEGKDLCAAKAVVACMFSQRFLSAWRNLFVLTAEI